MKKLRIISLSLSLIVIAFLFVGCTTPAYEGEIDLIVVPAVAFDKTGLRLGRGGGYYDKFLKKHARAMLIGVGYDFQLGDQVPAERHDQKVHRIILPSQTIVV